MPTAKYNYPTNYYKKDGTLKSSSSERKKQAKWRADHPPKRRGQSKLGTRVKQDKVKCWVRTAPSTGAKYTTCAKGDKQLRKNKPTPSRKRKASSVSGGSAPSPKAKRTRQKRSLPAGGGVAMVPADRTFNNPFLGSDGEPLR
eukprot:SAG11_NODE_653_length_7913_cov_86.345790_7_plen_143_part_00